MSQDVEFLDYIKCAKTPDHFIDNLPAAAVLNDCGHFVCNECYQNEETLICKLNTCKDSPVQNQKLIRSDMLNTYMQYQLDNKRKYYVEKFSRILGKKIKEMIHELYELKKKKAIIETTIHGQHDSIVYDDFENLKQRSHKNIARMKSDMRFK